jgi:hypothetical protein
LGKDAEEMLRQRLTFAEAVEQFGVEAVIRKIIPQKQQGAVPAIQDTLTDNLGEISRHLRGT